ncbi:hypothetical protein GCM10027280_16090 [Micromonospora polyrhachis]|uniref:Lipoprotein n=1 Tax=Micromonospora polyrhachis TaxID=1282883 RepID=A0A7W7WPQ8_9ACTN|nr:hypothetical protein [Micromonospora polyrhachis]MBB4958503.1 hypothetical protein [Micromonospora polyrhachis]
MRTPRAPAGPLTMVLATLALLLGACGSGPTAQVWAASVCAALTPWRAEISDLTSSTQQQMTAKTTPAQAKENLVRLLGGAEKASETARKKVAAAGVPDVEKGELVSREFLASLTAVRDAYAKAKNSIEGLGIGQAGAFYDGVKTAIDILNQEYAASALDTTNLDSPELEEAFDEVPECR